MHQGSMKSIGSLPQEGQEIHPDQAFYLKKVFDGTETQMTRFVEESTPDVQTSLPAYLLFVYSSYGQNLSTSTFIGETAFAILIAILGLVLFAHLIGNMQAAWRCYKRRRMAKDLMAMESFALDETVADETDPEDGLENSAGGSNPSQEKSNLGVTILASRYAANTRRGAQKLKGVGLSKLQKPDEPDFSAEPDE